MRRSKSSLFLMELIIIICFFALASVICMQLFAAAHTISRRSTGIQMAVMNAQNAAEIFVATGNTYGMWFDENWNEIYSGNYSDGRYKMEIQKTRQDNVIIADINVIDTFSEVELHSIRVKRLVN